MFRPHSSHSCSFTAVIREGCIEWRVPYGQLAQIIAIIGRVEKIDGSSIKPTEKHSFFLAGLVA